MAYVDAKATVCNDVICADGRGERTVEWRWPKCYMFLERVTTPIYEPFMGVKK